jgi:hypothetical protein
MRDKVKPAIAGESSGNPPGIETQASNGEDGSYPITIWSGLLTPHHRNRIGIAIWVFWWCIRRTTNEKNGFGYVLHGSRIKVSRIADELGVSERSVKTDLARLRRGGYIDVRRIPYGLVITVLRSKRWVAANREATSFPSEMGRNLPISRARWAESCPADGQNPAHIKENAFREYSKKRESSGSASPHRSSLTPKKKSPKTDPTTRYPESLYV